MQFLVPFPFFLYITLESELPLSHGHRKCADPLALAHFGFLIIGASNTSGYIVDSRVSQNTVQ